MKTQAHLAGLMRYVSDEIRVRGAFNVKAVDDEVE
jgi:hypothetical protein